MRRKEYERMAARTPDDGGQWKTPQNWSWLMVMDQNIAASRWKIIEKLVTVYG